MRGGALADPKKPDDALTFEYGYVDRPYPLTQQESEAKVSLEWDLLMYRQVQTDWQGNTPRGRAVEAETMVRSGRLDSLQQLQLEQGAPDEPAYVYAFTTASSKDALGKIIRRDESTYYMTQQEFDKTLATCQTDGKLDPNKVKDRFSLPCSNQCNQVIRRSVDASYPVWESTCNPMCEEVRALDANGNVVATDQYEMRGGGRQAFCMNGNFGPMKTHEHGLQLTEYQEHRKVLQARIDAKLAEKNAPGAAHEAGEKTLSQGDEGQERQP